MDQHHLLLRTDRSPTPGRPIAPSGVVSCQIGLARLLLPWRQALISAHTGGGPEGGGIIDGVAGGESMDFLSRFRRSRSGPTPQTEVSGVKRLGKLTPDRRPI